VSGTLLHAPVRGLAAATGLPLAAYHREHVRGCVVRMLRREQLTDVPALVAAIDADAALRTRLRRSIAVASSGLFRDPNQLRAMDEHILPSIVYGARRIRVWAAGCGAGEEAYTVATMLEWHGALGRAEIVGSDILTELLTEAEAGVVGGARIPAGMRGRVRWDERDLTSQGAPGEFDLVLCRDLLTYLRPAAAAAVERTLVGGLAKGGVIMVGRNEKLEQVEDLGLVQIADSAYRRLT